MRTFTHARAALLAALMLLVTTLGLQTPYTAQAAGDSDRSPNQRASTPATSAPKSQAARRASTDPFYTYTGRKPLADIAPGTIIRSRFRLYHIAGIPQLIAATQLQYRSVDALGNPAINVTSVLRPPIPQWVPKAVSLQSAYDSLNPEDSPSRTIAGSTRFGGVVLNVESAWIVPLLWQGYTVIVPDIEGQNADFAYGPEYGRLTLDSIRAALSNGWLTGLRTTSKVGLMGYSGGAIGTGWAAQLAESYAPDVEDNIVGAAYGGVLVAPHHNLTYVNGSGMWAGVMPMAIIGAARAEGIDFSRYLSPRGLQIYAELKDGSIVDALTRYSGLRWQDLTKPEYADPASMPEFVDVVNKLNMGAAPSPRIPVFIMQGANGALEGTAGDKPGIGPGDGVMVAGDVRTLARQFCDSGTSVLYWQDDNSSHVGSFIHFAPSAITWLNHRMWGWRPQDNCSSIPPGNPLEPMVYQPAVAPTS